MFKAETYIERRKKLSQKIESGILLFLGNEESPMNYPDNPYHFRQDSSFLYYWGLNQPGLAAIIDVDEGKEIVFGYDFTIDDVIWMGPQPTLREKCALVGVAEGRPVEKFAGFVKELLNKKRQIHYLPQYRGDNLLKLQELLNLSPPEINKKASVEFIKAVVEQRSVKSDEEIEEIAKALDISYEIHTLAMKMTKPDIYEREVVGAIKGKAYQLGANLSFPIIFSVHGETLHNHSHHNLMQEGDIVVNDCGGESGLGYAGDITRTIPVSGSFSNKQKKIYEIVLNSQLKSIEAIKPGIKFLDVHLIAAEVIAKGLINLGILKGNPPDVVAAGAHTLFFPHGLGHLMGLDVHDMENLGEDFVGYDDSIQRSSQFGLRSLRLAKKLVPGNVLTVEPGIYFIPQLIDLWEKENKFSEFINYDKIRDYRDFGGIRIEDNILVTESGNSVLGKPIPKTVADVEALASA